MDHLPHAWCGVSELAGEAFQGRIELAQLAGLAAARLDRIHDKYGSTAPFHAYRFVISIAKTLICLSAASIQ
jgi:hypothetical protein